MSNKQGQQSQRENRASGLPYRSDIDGLRAVAVLLVLGDHFRTHFTGGFVGVDVFFVISGYLISAAIIREQANGTFSIVNFYERRIRRIFPALLVMLLGTFAMAYHFLFPSEMVEFAHSMLASIFSFSNFLFWHQAGYFDAPSAFKPLLHTWSLAVEEQFYIVFPLLLVILRRFASRHLKWWVFALAAVSLLFAVVYIHRDASAAFFFAPLRAWELLLGTIVSQRYLPSIRSALARNLATFTGLACILIPALRYTDQTPFPGLAAIPPCVGAALIIAAGETGSSAVGRLLSLRPVVFIGLISYSLYLWHWPILVFQNLDSMLVQLLPSDRRVKLLLFVVSLAAGTLSWRFVETPFRKGIFRPRRRPLFLINGAAVALIMAIAFTILLTGGLPSRFPPEALQAAKYLKYNQAKPYRMGTCFLASRDTFSDFQQSTCLAPLAGRQNVLIYGDSQAAQLYFGLNQVFPEIHFLQSTASNCPLYLNQPAQSLRGCRPLAEFIHAHYLPATHLDAVLLSGRWRDASIPDLDRQIRWMQQRHIALILVGPGPEYDLPLPRLLGLSLRDHRPDLIPQHLDRAANDTDDKLRRLARDTWHIPYISMIDVLCTPDCVQYGAPDVPVFFDGHHFTAEGSVLFAQRLRAAGVSLIP